MRSIVGVGIAVLISVSIWAQQRQGQSQSPPPLQGGQVTAADIAAIVAKQPKDRNGNQTFLQLAPYNVNLEHRVMVATANVHEKEAELFYVVDGGGTIVTGGKLVGEQRTNGENLSGSAIDGGMSRKLAKGDFVLVPEGVPHWFSTIDGSLTMMSLHLPRTPGGK
jgi:mannose-6-phosphate isomerase-like protein (cupin superfamily)